MNIEDEKIFNVTIRFDDRKDGIMSNKNNESRKENNNMVKNKIVFEEIMKTQSGADVLKVLTLILKSEDNKKYTKVISEIIEKVSFKFIWMYLDVDKLDKVFETTENPEELFYKMLNFLITVSAGVLDFNELCQLKEE